jgi:AcrR family transcriptional regulator
MTTYLTSAQTFNRTGASTADLLRSSNDAYRSIRVLFGKIAALTIASFGVVFLRLILWFLEIRLKKSCRTDFDITAENYMDLKKAHLVLLEKVTPLMGLKKIKPAEMPFLLRGAFRQILRILDILDTYNTAMSAKLEVLDNLKTGEAHFQVVKESTLWDMRTPHYAYRF